MHAGLEPDGADGKFAIRRGLTSVNGLSEEAADTIVAARAEQPFTGLEDFARRTRLPARLMEQLATADAFAAFAEHRRSALWTAGAFPAPTSPTSPASAPSPPPPTCRS